MVKFCVCIALWLTGFLVCGQEKAHDIEDFIPTSSISSDKKFKKNSNRPKRQNIDLIYVSSPAKILYGNACATSETHKMGFEYVLESRNGQVSKTKTGKFLHNFWVKTKLVVTRSPFWKTILVSRIKKCKEQTGDFVG